MHLQSSVSLAVLASLLLTSGCAPPPPPKFRVLMVTDSGRSLAADSAPAVRPWQDWRDPESVDRTRLLDEPAFRLANRLMDRGDMVIDIAASPQALTPDNIGGYDGLLLDIGSSPASWPGGPQALARAIERGRGLVAIGGSVATFGDDACWRELIGGRVSLPHSEGLTRLAVLDPEHPTTFALGTTWDVADRFCDVAGLAPDVRLLIRTARALPGRDDCEPVAWAREVGQGRVFILTFGHEPAVRGRQEFVTVVHDAIRWTGRMTEEMHNQLTLGERNAGFALLFDGIDPTGFRGWTVKSGELTCRIDGGQESSLACSTSVNLSDLRFDFMPVRGRASLRIDRCVGNPSSPVTASLPLNYDLPAEVTKTLWPDGWHQARVHVDDKMARLWIDGLPAGRAPVDLKDHAASMRITWLLKDGPGSELRLRDVKGRDNSSR